MTSLHARVLRLDEAEDNSSSDCEEIEPITRLAGG